MASSLQVYSEIRGNLYPALKDSPDREVAILRDGFSSFQAKFRVRFDRLRSCTSGSCANQNLLAERSETSRKLGEGRMGQPIPLVVQHNL